MGRNYHIIKLYTGICSSCLFNSVLLRNFWCSVVCWLFGFFVWISSHTSFSSCSTEG